MSATSAPAVKKELLELLKAAAALSGVQISYDHPGAEVQQEAIYFRRTISHEEAATLGRKRRDEDYEIEVIVDSVRDDNNPQAGEERCWELVSAVEEVLRANPDMAGVSGWTVFTGGEMTPYMKGAGWLHECICTVHVKHRK